MLPKMIEVDGLLKTEKGLPVGYSVVRRCYDRDSYLCAPHWLAKVYRLLPISLGWSRPPQYGAGFFTQWIMWERFGIARVERDGYYWLVRWGKHTFYFWTSPTAYKHYHPTTPYKLFTRMTL